ncbi:MAG: S1 RNA-binding domain-containing protein, partial [Chloroflexi bacterium]|nr:S1 RNA-binding domain-containing protein [Chloroflexota bacterium]
MESILKVFTAETPPDESWWASILLDFEEQNIGYTANNNLVDQPHIVNWDWAVNQYQQDKIIEFTVTGHNRGGLLVKNKHILGFVPLSHLVDLPKKYLPSQHKAILETYLGRSLKLKIIECSTERERVVLSERAALSAPGMRLELLQSLTVGDCVRGRVTTVTKFGVFVDLGGVEGLIHI